MDLARTTCRAAETWLHEATAASEISSPIHSYINRLSDMFFVLKRKLHHDTDQLEAKFRDLRTRSVPLSAASADSGGGGGGAAADPAEP